MNAGTIYRIMALLLVAVLAAAAPRQATAAGTDRNTSITNKATVNYSVGAVGQTLIESSPTGNSTAGVGNGTNTSFVVDDKVIVTVADASGGVVDTYPGAANLHAMKFTISNSGNGAHDFAVLYGLASENMDGGVPTAALYEDTNNDGAWQSDGTDKTAGGVGAVYLKLSGGTAYIDEMAKDTGKTVFLVVTSPAGALNGQTANFYLTAEAHNDLAEVRAGGTAGSLGAVTAANSADANSAALLDIVLADAASDAGDAAYNGKYRKDGTNGFRINLGTLNVQKTASVVSDPVNATTNPKAIPLAVVEYTIRVTYTAGPFNSTGITISDTVPVNTLALNNQYGAAGEVRRIVSTNGGGASVTDDLDTAALTNWGTAAGNLFTAPCGITFDEDGDYCEIKYRVEIQ